MKEKTLVAGADAGAETAAAAPDPRLEAVLQEYGRFLRATIVRLCPRHLGLQFDDIEQEARLRLWRALRSEREIRDLASYIYRVAATATIDALRRVKARREERLAEAGEDEPTGGSETERAVFLGPDSTEQATHRRLLIERVQHTLAGLPHERRRALGLHLQGYTTEETGRLLGWTESKARNLTYRALAELRERLRAEGVVYEGE